MALDTTPRQRELTTTRPEVGRHRKPPSTLPRGRHRFVPPPGLLRQRNFQLLWLGETVSKTGSAITVVALPLVAISTLQASTFMVGVLEAAAWLPWLLIGLPAGAWVDRLARRPIMVTCNIVSALLFASVPVAAWYGWLSLPQLLAVAFFAGIAKVFFRTAYQAYLPTVVDRTRLPEGNAAMQGSASAAEVGGPGLAGVMAQALGAVTAVLADAISFLVSAFCLLRIDARESRSERARRNTGLFRQIGEGLRYVVKDPYLRTLTVFGALGNLTLMAFNTLLLVFLIRVVQVHAGVAGLLMAGMGIGGVFGALSAKAVIRRFGTAGGLLSSVAFTSPFVLLLPLTEKSTSRLALFAVGAAVLSAGVVIGSIIASSFRQAYCPPQMLGRVSAVVSFLVFGTMPIGALIGGFTGSTLGVRPALWVLAGCVMLPVLVLLFSPISRSRDLPGM